MKSDAKCKFCGEQIISNRQLVIFNTPRFGIKYQMAHKNCFLKYKNEHPMPMKNLAEILNSSATWLRIFVIALLPSILLALRISRGPDDMSRSISMGTILPLLAIVIGGYVAYLITVRMYYYMRYE